MGQHFSLFDTDQLVVSNEMGSLEEVVTVSLAEMEEGEIVDHGDGDPDGINLFSVPFKALFLPGTGVVLESVFSHQNLILTNRRFRMVINKVGIKVFIKYCFFFSSARNKSRKSLMRLQILLNTFISVFILISHPYRHIIS